MSCYITYKGKNYTQEDFIDFLRSQIPSSSTPNNPAEFTNHSGGAYNNNKDIDPQTGRNFRTNTSGQSTNENKATISKPQVKPVTKDTAAKIKSLFDTQGFIEIDTANKTNKELIVIISNYVLEELGHVTPQKKLEAVQSGFKLSNYITTEEISPTRTRVKTNMRNLLKDEVEDTPISLGGINFTSSGDSYAKDAFTCK